MEHESLLPCSHDPATGPYVEAHIPCFNFPQTFVKCFKSSILYDVGAPTQPPSNSPLRITARSQCRSTHITTFQLTAIHHSNATSLFPILLSLQPPVSAHNSRNKRSFPSQLLTQHFRANSHAY